MNRQSNDREYIGRMIAARSAQLQKQGDTPRNANECAAMDWDMHTGRIPKSDWPDGWKDPYAKLDKAAKTKPKPKPKTKTTKAKAKK